MDSLSLEVYAQEHFKLPKSKKERSNERLIIAELVSYSPNPITKPLLSQVPKNAVKLAILTFKQILDYINNRDETHLLIVLTLSGHHELIDEVYFQIIKQTYNCPERGILMHAWDLLLIISTIFPASLEAQDTIKSYLYQQSQSYDRQVAIIAQFTLIRFSSRCTIAEIPELDAKYINDIPNHPQTTTAVFGVSLYEIMWGQRRTNPRCPLPYFLVQMSEALIKTGGTHTEGIFRKPGNMKRVHEMMEQANRGIDVFTFANPYDISSLYKEWFRDLVDPLVPFDMMFSIENCLINHKAVEFAEQLPGLHAITLAYLIGFLQEMAKYENETKMSISNYAMVFAPNIVFVQNKEDLELSRRFIFQLINDWDVSSIYPFPSELLSPSPQ